MNGNYLLSFVKKNARSSYAAGQRGFAQTAYVIGMYRLKRFSSFKFSALEKRFNCKITKGVTFAIVKFKV